MKIAIRNTITSNGQQVLGCIQAGDSCTSLGGDLGGQSGTTSHVQIVGSDLQVYAIKCFQIDRATGWLLDRRPVGGGRAPESAIHPRGGSPLFHGGTPYRGHPDSVKRRRNQAGEQVSDSPPSTAAASEGSVISLADRRARRALPQVDSRRLTTDKLTAFSVIVRASHRSARAVPGFSIAWN